MNSIDARVRYTRMIIEQSFLELLKQKPVAKITVTELCEKAQINRATFYKHYLDVQDLLDKLEEQLFTQIRQAFSGKDLELKTFLQEMLRYTFREQERFFALGGSNGDPNLMAKTFKVCYESAYPLLEQNLPGISEDERRMLYHYLSQGAGGVLTWWVMDGMRLSPEEIAEFVLGVSSITANGMLKQDWRTIYRE